MPKALPLLTAHDRTRASPFSYDCKACGRCCRNKVIRVNPYEIARLAEHLGTTTTEVLTKYTESGGAALTATDDGWCVFFDPRTGCTVHPSRPLVCRLYPLGRHARPDGSETFAVVAPEPGSEGIYGDRATIDDYLAVQGAGPYLEATSRYLDALRALLPVFASREDAVAVADEARAAMTGPPPGGDDNLLDVDAVVGEECAERGVPVPSSVDARVDLHLAFLERLVATAG